MAVIPSSLHGLIDYVAGVGLLLLPPVLGLQASVPLVALQVVGLLTLLSSLITDYRFSLLKLIPFRLHLLLDIGLGLAMLLLAWTTSRDGSFALLVGVAAVYLAVPALSWPARRDQPAYRVPPE